jgi:hypothetical protein
MTFPNEEVLGWLMKNRIGWKGVQQYADSGENKALWNSFYDLESSVNNGECTSSPPYFYIAGVRGPVPLKRNFCEIHIQFRCCGK